MIILDCDNDNNQENIQNNKNLTNKKPFVKRLLKQKKKKKVFLFNCKKK